MDELRARAVELKCGSDAPLSGTYSSGFLDARMGMRGRGLTPGIGAPSMTGWAGQPAP